MAQLLKKMEAQIKARMAAEAAEASAKREVRNALTTVCAIHQFVGGGPAEEAAARAQREVRTAPVITGTRRCKLAVSVFKERAAKPVSNR